VAHIQEKEDKMAYGKGKKSGKGMNVKTGKYCK